MIHDNGGIQWRLDLGQGTPLYQASGIPKTNSIVELYERSKQIQAIMEVTHVICDSNWTQALVDLEFLIIKLEMMGEKNES